MAQVEAEVSHSYPLGLGQGKQGSKPGRRHRSIDDDGEDIRTNRRVLQAKGWMEEASDAHESVSSRNSWARDSPGRVRHLSRWWNCLQQDLRSFALPISPPCCSFFTFAFSLRFVIVIVIVSQISFLPPFSVFRLFFLLFPLQRECVQFPKLGVLTLPIINLFVSHSVVSSNAT